MDAESVLDAEWQCGYRQTVVQSELGGFHHAFAETP
jgi:hypothetical protein